VGSHPVLPLESANSKIMLNCSCHVFKTLGILSPVFLFIYYYDPSNLCPKQNNLLIEISFFFRVLCMWFSNFFRLEPKHDAGRYLSLILVWHLSLLFSPIHQLVFKNCQTPFHQPSLVANNQLSAKSIPRAVEWALPKTQSNKSWNALFPTAGRKQEQPLVRYAQVDIIGLYGPSEVHCENGNRGRATAADRKRSLRLGIQDHQGAT